MPSGSWRMRGRPFHLPGRGRPPAVAPRPGQRLQMRSRCRQGVRWRLGFSSLSPTGSRRAVPMARW
eukprot:11928415-Alexandrium_andersonii.AAC.1